MLRLLEKARRDERGAVLITSAILSTVFMLVAAFAVDLGMQRVARRDMQAIADVIALDLARELDGRTKQVLAGSSDWIDAKAQSIARNNDTVGDTPVVAVELGTLVNGVFVASANADVPTAVKVTSSSKVDFSFRGGEGGAFRTAVAVAEANACFAIGSYAAMLETDKSDLLYPLLEEKLGTSLNLGAVGYGGLANVNLTVLDLLEVERLDVGTVDELLDTSISLADFYVVMADALRSNGDTANANVLENTLSTHIGAVLSDIRIGHSELAPGLLNISQGNNSALGTQLNVFDLVTGAAFLATGGSAVSVPALGLNLPLLGTVSGSLSVIQPPQTNCGPVGTTQDTEQVTVGPLSANLTSIPAITVAGLTNVGVTTPNPVALSASLASAIGTLASVSCAPETMSVDVTSELASAHLSVPVRVTAQVNLLGIGLVNLVLPVTVKLDTTPSTHSRTASFTGPYPQMSSTGSGQLGLANATASITLDSSWTARVLFLDVKSNPLVQTTVNTVLPTIMNSLLSSVVTPLAQSIDSIILGPLQRMLGLTVAGADVWALKTDFACNVPALRG